MLQAKRLTHFSYLLGQIIISSDSCRLGDDNAANVCAVIAYLAAHLAASGVN